MNTHHDVIAKVPCGTQLARWRYAKNTVGSGSALRPWRAIGWVLEIRLGPLFAGDRSTLDDGTKLIGHSLFIGWHSGSRKYRKRMCGLKSWFPLEFGITKQARNIPLVETASGMKKP